MDLNNLNKDRAGKRKPAVDISTMIYGKVPPQAKELELTVLGSILLDHRIFDEVTDILRPEHFYVTAHQFVFQAMMNLNRVGQPMDMLSVVQELKRMEKLEDVGGAYYMTTLTDRVVSSASVVAHGRIIFQKFLQRELIRISGETITDAYDDSTDVFELMERHEKAFTAISLSVNTSTYTPIDTALVKSLKRIEELRKQSHHITGVPTGFHFLDKATHGWQPGDLIILAARPSVGKTAFALQLCRYAANNVYKSVGVAFFSLEMSEAQLMDRAISSESDVWMDNIKNGRLSDSQMETIYQTAIPRLSKSKIFICDRASLTLFELRAICRKLARKEKLGLIVIDYLQLMSGSGEKGQNREQEISTISRGLKQLAKELQLPIVSLSQLSRAVENRTGEKKMPQLSDLRESGAIEQDADVVMFMYRPEYYDQQFDGDGESTKGLTELKIAKNRQGSLDTIRLKANLSTQKFYDWEDDPATVVKQPGTWVRAPLPSEKDDDQPF